MISSMSSFAASPPAASSARKRSLACSTPMILSGSLAPDRQARIGRGDDLADQFRRGGRSALSVTHLGAMDHHVGDLQLAQIEHAAEHVAVAARDAALLVQDVDRAFQFLVARQHRAAAGQFDAEQLQDAAHEALRRRPAPGRRWRRKMRRVRATEQRHAVGIVDRHASSASPRRKPAAVPS